MSVRVFLISICTLFGLLMGTVGADSYQREIEHDGKSRSYFLHIPSAYNDQQSVPLVVMLHGRGGTGKGGAVLSEFNERADKHNFIVVYPDGLSGTWFYPRGIGGFGDSPNDTEFIIAVILELQGKYNIDPGKIYATGISNGGFMAQRLACDAPKRFAAVASVAAGGFAGVELVCNKNIAVPIVFFTALTIRRYHGVDAG